MSIPPEKRPKTLALAEAGKLIGMTSGGLRGAIGRKRLIGFKEDGKNYVATHNLASYLLYGFAYPEEKMSDGMKEQLHNFLWVRYSDETSSD